MVVFTVVIVRAAPIARGIAAVICLVSACASKDSAGPGNTARPASAVPWQPHGLRVPTVHCTLTVPAGWSQSSAPMPDHIAELSAAGFKSLAIVSQRVEPDLAAARERVITYYRSGLLTAAGAKVLIDAPLDGAGANGQLLSMRYGPAGAGRIETVILLAFPGQPLVDIVARHDESDGQARDAVLALARSARCSHL